MGQSSTVSEINGNLSRKPQNYSIHHRVFCAPAAGFPLGIGYRCNGQKLEWWDYQVVKKSFMISLSVQTQYWRVTDGHLSTPKTVRMADKTSTIYLRMQISHVHSHVIGWARRPQI